MKKSIIILAAIIMMASFSVQATVAPSNTATANATAKILAALSIIKNVDLSFGTMTIPTAATTVIVAPDGTRTSTGNITLLAQAPLTTASSYSVTGDPGATYTITLPASTTILNGTQQMTVNNFTSSKTNNGSTIGTGGTDSFTVGATLNLNNAQASGTYTGSFNVTVNYN
jgi:hypothetical protein